MPQITMVSFQYTAQGGETIRRPGGWGGGSLKKSVLIERDIKYKFDMSTRYLQGGRGEGMHPPPLPPGSLKEIPARISKAENIQNNTVSQLSGSDKPEQTKWHTTRNQVCERL